VALNTEKEIAGIFNAIQQVAKESKVDHRFILAEILQESTACVRVQTTKAPGDVEIFNPGLMQDHGYVGFSEFETIKHVVIVDSIY
jgi:hypothetical protein